jgi:hypothetical protein
MLSGHLKIFLFAAAAVVWGGLASPASADDGVVPTTVAKPAASDEVPSPSPAKVAEVEPASRNVVEPAPRNVDAAPGFAKSTVTGHSTHNRRKTAAYRWRASRLTRLTWNAPVHGCPPSCGRLLMLGVGF